MASVGRRRHPARQHAGVWADDAALFLSPAIRRASSAQVMRNFDRPFQRPVGADFDIHGCCFCPRSELVEIYSDFTPWGSQSEHCAASGMGVSGNSRQGGALWLQSLEDGALSHGFGRTVESAWRGVSQPRPRMTNADVAHPNSDLETTTSVD